MHEGHYLRKKGYGRLNFHQQFSMLRTGPDLSSTSRVSLKQHGGAMMLKKIVMALFLFGSMGMMLTACDAPEVETEEVDDD